MNEERMAASEEMCNAGIAPGGATGTDGLSAGGQQNGGNEYVAEAEYEVVE